jgi:hypothetical protein
LVFFNHTDFRKNLDLAKHYIDCEWFPHNESNNDLDFKNLNFLKFCLKNKGKAKVSIRA